MDWILNPWLIYALAILVISGAVGLHLGKFHSAYTEMTGMMAGMAMGMLNGFLLGYAVAAATSSMFWGNLFGILLGLSLGVYYGRAGGLMGMLDGGMGGVMGGSMGAMLAVMLFPPFYVFWTALLLSFLYVLGMAALVVLIERSDLSHAALHRTFPWLMRAIAEEVADVDYGSPTARRQTTDDGKYDQARLTDYYSLLGIAQSAGSKAVSEAYMQRLAASTGDESIRLERAFATLSDPQKRTVYDRSLASAGADCCPPKRKKVAVAAEVVTAPSRAKTTYANQQTRPSQQQRPKSSNSQRSHQDARSHSQQHQAQRPRQHAHRGPHRGRRDAPVSWIGVLALLVTGVFVAAWWLTSSGNAAPPAARWEPQMGHASVPDKAQIDGQAVAATLGADGVQTLDFKVNGDRMAYAPNVIKVKRGVPARFNISTEGRDPG